MLAKISDIKRIIAALNKDIIDHLECLELIDAHKISITKILDTDKQALLKEDLFIFNQLAHNELVKKTHENQSTSENFDKDKELLEGLSTQADECIKQLNVLLANSSTISICALTHDCIKNGILPVHIAREMCAEFISADIPDNFDELFNHYFPEDILTNVSDRPFHIGLTESPLLFVPTIGATELPAQEFEKQLPATLQPASFPWIDITYNTSKKCTCMIPSCFISNLIYANGTLTTIINPKYNVLLAYEIDAIKDANAICIINTNNLTSIFFRASKIKQIGLNTDCTQLSIMHKDDTIFSCLLPPEILTLAPSLKQRAFLAYSHEKMYKIIASSLPDWEREVPDFISIATFFKQNANLPVYTLDKFLSFTKKNKSLISESLYESIYSNKVNRIRRVLDYYIGLKIVSKVLNITTKTLYDQVISNEITHENLNKIMIETMDSADSAASERIRNDIRAEMDQQNNK